MSLYDLRVSRVQLLNAHSGRVQAVGFSPDGKTLFATAGDVGQVSLFAIDPATDRVRTLVRDGVASIEDIDTAMRDGLARRWSFMGPFETIDLNAPGGVSAFLQRYRDAYDAIGKGRPDRPAWSGTLAEEVIAACRSVRPLETLDDRQAWRNEQLAALSAFKQHNGKA